MHPDFGGSLVIQMEVEEVSPSPKSTTKQPSRTKERSSRNMTSATSPDTVVHVGYDAFGNPLYEYQD
jgi:hypothetical protein